MVVKLYRNIIYWVGGCEHIAGCLVKEKTQPGPKTSKYLRINKTLSCFYGKQVSWWSENGIKGIGGVFAVN